MTREEKSQVIENLTTQLADSTNIYLADISGLNADNTSKLRRACFKQGIKLAVVKNTLLAKAMEASDKDFAELPEVLKGNTAIMLSETGNAPAKDIKSREELIGEIVGLLQSPAKNVISALKSGGSTIAGIIKTLSEKEG